MTDHKPFRSSKQTRSGSRPLVRKRDAAKAPRSLKVVGDAAVVIEPSKGPFDHPSARQDCKVGSGALNA